MSNVKPDIIIPFIYNLDELRSCAVVYVRPQTNKLNYEKAIILGCQEFGDIVYLANIGGNIFIQNLLILEHYSTQYFFAMHSKSVISEYPEMVEVFENHFNISFNDATILSPFDAQLKLNMTSSQLFDTIVDNNDFLKLYGQTIKKIGNYFVINYDIPEIIAKYTPDTNVFVVALIFHDNNIKLTELNQAIFENLKSDVSTPLIDEEKFKTHQWYDKVRRTYHISSNHIATMFDMKDFVFSANGSEIEFKEIPLSDFIIQSKIVTEADLLAIKRFSLVYIINDDGSETLINIQEAAHNMTLEQCINLFKRINYNKIRR